MVIKMTKYLKWAFSNNIGHTDNQKFEIGEIIVCDTWNPKNEDWDKRGGFNFTNEECALRWFSRGDTLYEVTLPEGAEMINVRNDKTPGGILVANKIIMNNPIPISEELLFDFYNKSKLPLETYFEIIGLLASRGFIELAKTIIKDKVTLDNIDLALEKFNNSIKPWHKVDMNSYNEVKEILEEINSDYLLNLYIDKDPYIKELTNNSIINLTGQSGSGKSTYASKNFNSNKYLVIDTDDIFSDTRYKNANGINKELGNYFRNKYPTLPNCGNDFDLIYTEILDYCRKYDNKTIVIDCAQIHSIHDIKLLKGKLIVIRTSINNCYERTIKRYIKNNPNVNEEDINKFKERKKALYDWYKYSNEFLKRINK